MRRRSAIPRQSVGASNFERRGAGATQREKREREYVPGPAATLVDSKCGAGRFQYCHCRAREETRCTVVGLDGAFYLRDPAALLKHPKVGVGGFLRVSMRLFQPPLYQPKVKPKAAVVTVPDVTVFCPRDRKDAHP